MTRINPLVSRDAERTIAPGSIWWRTVCEIYDRAAIRVLERDLARGIRVAMRAGRVAHASGLLGPTRREVASLFPWLGRARASVIAARGAELRCMNRASIALVQRRGFAALARLIVDASAMPPAVFDRPTRGVVVIAGHIGAQFGVTAALHRWQVPTLALRHQADTGGDARAQVLKQAVEWLRQGGVVLAAIDGPGGASTDPVACLGRRIVLRRGPFMLARVTGAPIVPAVARWTRDGHVAVSVGAALRPGAADNVREHADARAAARWLETSLVTRPEDIWPYTLRNLLDAPLDVDWRDLNWQTSPHPETNARPRDAAVPRI